MSTNPVGKESKTIGINMPNTMAEDLELRAASMGLSASNYCKIVLRNWMKGGKKLKLLEG